LLVDRLLPTAIIVVLFASAVALMVLGWRSRRRRQAGLSVPRAVPASLQPALLTVDGWYVATTHERQPLERIAVHGLGFRARATVSVHADGLVFDRRGSEPIYVPLAALQSAGRATWAIDRVVERDGLVVIGWMLGSTPVDSYFRLLERDDADRLVLTITHMLPTAETIEEVAS